MRFEQVAGTFEELTLNGEVHTDGGEFEDGYEERTIARQVV